MSNRLIGEITIKDIPYYQSESGSNEITKVFTLGDSDAGIVEQNIRKYIYNGEKQILAEYTDILKDKAIKEHTK